MSAVARIASGRPNIVGVPLDTLEGMVASHDWLDDDVPSPI